MTGIVDPTARAVMPAPVVATVARLSALSPDQLFTLNQLADLIMATTQNSLLVAIRNSDNSAGTQEIALPGAGTYQLVVDAQNNVSFQPAPAMPAVNPTRVETLALDATVTVGTIKTVPLVTPMPDANYEILVFMRGLPGAVVEVPGSKTANSFQVRVTAVVVGTIAFGLLHDLA